MNFTKMHGAANDYVFIDARNIKKDWNQLAVEISDRNKGVGSDGIILALSSGQHDVKMRMFNADGSEGDMCGNGIRCFAAFAIKCGFVDKDKNPIFVETKSGIKSVLPITTENIITAAKVNMGKPIFKPEEIPVNINSKLERIVDYPLPVGLETFDITCVSMGNPHAISFISTPVDSVDLVEVGPLVENHAFFPDRVNFEIVNVINKSYVKARVWERGSGITMACGTGACAIACAGIYKGILNQHIEVELPGGTLQIEWSGNDDDDVMMTGPVTEVFEGEWK
tara:strand:- start:641 stop:1486 length:846 start_codon:yes stop_codon:yes gene_type:complete